MHPLIVPKVPFPLWPSKERGKKPSRRSNLRICFVLPERGGFSFGIRCIKEGAEVYVHYLSIYPLGGEGVHCVFAQRSKGE